MLMLAVEFLLVGALGGAIGLIITHSPVAGVAVGAGVAIFVDLIGWLVAVRATIALTHTVETTPEQAKVLHDVVEGLCIRTGLPKPKVYIVDDPAPNAFAFGRSPEHSGLAVTSGLLNLMSRRELEGVLAHEMSHIRNRDVQVTTLAVTTVGLLVASPTICGPRDLVRRLGRQQRQRRARADRGRGGCRRARRSARGCSRSRSPVTARSWPTRAPRRSCRPTVSAARSRSSKPTTPCCTTCPRATAHLWLVAPLHTRATHSTRAQPAVRHAPAARRAHRDPAQARGARPERARPGRPDQHRCARRSRQARGLDRAPHARDPVRRRPRASALHGDAPAAGEPGTTSRRRRGAPGTAPDRSSARLVPRRRGEPCATGTARTGPTGPRTGTAAAGCGRADLR